MKHQLYIVNSFTEEMGKGNPAGVVFLETELPTNEMQLIAYEINKSETAFVLQEGDGYRIRWFSPIKEVSLCGHATLAASKVLFEKNNVDQINFCYVDGKISVKHEDDGFIAMCFPLDDYYEAVIDNEYFSFFNDLPIKQCIKGKKTKKR